MIVTKITGILLFLFITFSSGFYKAPNLQEKKLPIAVMAYYVPEKDYHPDLLPLDQLTHIIFSFTNVIDGKMQFKHPENAEKLQALVAQKNKYPNLKVMIACGGWGADGFSDMASTPENIQIFVNSAVAFIEKYQLDGLDIDWEYPGISGAGTKFRESDKQRFTELMKALRTGLNAIERPQTLTFAAAGWKRYYNHIELDKVMPYVDYMNIMTYDLFGGNSPYTGHHTALGAITKKDLENYPISDLWKDKNDDPEKNSVSWEPRSAENIIAFCLENGVKPEKIIVGAAFYGRAWKGVPATQNGLYQPNKGVHIGWSSYKHIKKEFENKNGFQRHWDTIAKAPYLYNPKDSIFISYDDPISVGLKTKFAIDNKLGGIMFWELGNDTKENNSLLDAIYKSAISAY